jgi:hypothetical protein
MKQKQQFRPSNLRTILAVLLVVISVGGGALFYWGLTIVRDYAVTVNQRAVDAVASSKQVQELQVLKNQLTQSDSLISKANQLFASPTSYQAQVLNDVRAYAGAAGLSIANTSFPNTSETGTYSIVLTFKAPVSYSKLITFLNNVEGNLPKLQVSEITLGYVNGGADSVQVGEVKIQVAVR